MSDAPNASPAPSDGHAADVEDTATSHVADSAANAAADALIDQAEANPIRPGEPANAHARDA